MNFRRYYIPGSAIFITQIVQDRKPFFRDPGNLSLLRETWRNVKEIHPFAMLGYVFLFEHFHDIMHSLKMNFTREYKKRLGLSPSESVIFWQKRFWDHIIRDDHDLENHLHYIHFNPVKHGYVSDLQAWNHSSYVELEQRGLYRSALKGDEPKNRNGGE